MSNVLLAIGVAGVLVVGLTACGTTQATPATPVHTVSPKVIMTATPTPATSVGTNLTSISNDLDGANNAATQSDADTTSGDQAANTPDQPAAGTN